MDFIAFHFLATKLANIYDTVIYKAKKNEVKFREIIFCQTHNLEVLGSSPSWSTNKKALAISMQVLFLSHGKASKPSLHICPNEIGSGNLAAVLQ